MAANTPADEPSLPTRRLVELLEDLGGKGMSQAQVAQRASVTAQYVSDVRHGHRPLTELFARRLAEEFGVDHQWLLGIVDSPERPVMSRTRSPNEKTWLPMLAQAIAGEPQMHPRWSGAYIELSGVAAIQAAQAVQPYVLQFGHADREGRLRKGDFVLVSQGPAENSELSIVRCGKKILLARKKGGKWLQVATGEPLRGDFKVVGHCLGIVWSAMT